MIRKNICLFENTLHDGIIKWYIEESGQMVHIPGKPNFSRFKNKGYRVFKMGMTTNNPVIMFPNNDREVGERYSPPSDSSGEWWNVNPAAFFDVYPELRDKVVKCQCIQK